MKNIVNTLVKSSLIIASLITLSACIVIANPSNASKVNKHFMTSVELNASELTGLYVDSGAGMLTIQGKDGIESIQVSADIYTTEKLQDAYELTLEKSNDKAFLVAKHHSTSGFWVGSSPRIDVVVTVPANLMLEVKDGSGAMSITGINANVVVDDGSGDIVISKVNGNVTIDDGSGNIALSDVIGKVDIEDNSGDVMVKQVTGNVALDDGSGNLVIENVTGDLVVNDNSGDIWIRIISGKITLSDGSGDIDIDTAGSLNITEEGSGTLRVKNVKNNFAIGS